MQAPPPTSSSLPHLGCPGGSGHSAHQPAGHGTSSAASGPGLQGSVGSVCSSSPPSHFSLFQTVNLGSGLTVLFPHFHGSEPSNVFTCKMPGDLRLFWPEDGVARPPPRLNGSRGGRGTGPAPCSLRAGFLPSRWSRASPGRMLEAPLPWTRASGFPRFSAARAQVR